MKKLNPKENKRNPKGMSRREFFKLIFGLSRKNREKEDENHDAIRHRQNSDIGYGRRTHRW